jgi:hypothetical protein
MSDIQKDRKLIEEQMVIVGSQSSGETPVSFQVLQNIYNEITGKREELEKNYKTPYQMTLEDIEQLNIKINQLCEQYNIKSSNCSVTVVYSRDTKETFSSFERFKLLNSNSLSETERVVLEYNFLVILPKIQRPQSYEIEINLASKISLSKSIPDPIKGSFGILRFFVGLSAHVSIKFVDYLVARNFQDVISEFIEGLKTPKQNSLVKFIIKKSSWVPIITKYSTCILFLYLTLKTISIFIPSNSTNLNTFGIYLLSSSFILFCSYRAGYRLGRIIEDALDEYQDVSYIQLTKGDKNLIEEVKRKNKHKIITAIVAAVATLLLGIVASVIANLLTK